MTSWKTLLFFNLCGMAQYHSIQMDLALFIYFLNCQKKPKFIGPTAKIWENTKCLLLNVLES
jgi:hypothetical protein